MTASRFGASTMLAAQETMNWEKIDPPMWWPAAGRFIMADRTLPDGTRQHMVQGRVAHGTVIANAEVIGADDAPDAAFSESLSHLSITPSAKAP